MFDYYVSLGSMCMVASSMSKYGLRSFSAPFDWLVTLNFNEVLHYIETDFKDFLLQENLERLEDQPNCFYDKKSGVRFLHDNENFETEYDKLKDKYNRRIDRFINKSKNRMCYLRTMRSKEELEYVMSNTDYIKYVIQKNNCYSEVVFLCSDDLAIPNEFPFRHYIMQGIYSGASEKEIRAHFDCANDFLEFCGENYLGKNLIKNLAFDIEKQKKESQEARLLLVERRYKTLTALLTHDFSCDRISEKTIIYGAGMVGKELYKKIKNYTSVICFIDRRTKESNFEGVPIIQVDKVKREEGVKVIVSAAYDFQSIKDGLAGKFQVEDIISLDEILNLTF